jgi:hypothetical protein
MQKTQLKTAGYFVLAILNSYFICLKAVMTALATAITLVGGASNFGDFPA